MIVQCGQLSTCQDRVVPSGFLHAWPAILSRSLYSLRFGPIAGKVGKALLFKCV